MRKETAEGLMHYLCNQYYKDRSENFIEIAHELFDKTFSVKWSGGGTSGSCWSDELSEVEPEDEPGLEVVDRLLLYFFPGMHIDYKDKTETDTLYDSDYYGGQTETHEKTLKMSDLIALIDKYCEHYHEEFSDGESRAVDYYDMVDVYGQHIDSAQSYQEIKDALDLKADLEKSLPMKKNTQRKKI